MSQERIAPGQVMTLLLASRLSQSLVFWGTVTGIGQDNWWETTLGVLAGIPFIWMLNALWLRYPDLGLLGIAEKLLGKLLGKVLGLLYCLFFLLLCSLTIRLVAAFIRFAFLPHTPRVLVMAMVAFLAVYTIRNGLEVAARISQVVTPALTIAILLVVLLVAKDFQLRFFWPLGFLYKNPLLFLQDAIGVHARTVEWLWIGLMIPMLTCRQELKRLLVRGQVLLSLLLGAMAIGMVGTLGGEMEFHYFPFYQVTRLVSVADFLERMDIVVATVWPLGMILRTSMLLWATAHSTAHLFQLPDHKPLLVPLGALSIVLAVAQAESFSELQSFISFPVYTPFTLTFVLLIPLLLLLVALVRGKKGPADQCQAPPSQPG